LNRALALSFRLDDYRALQAAEDAVLDKLAAGVILLDRKARVIYTNTAARACGREGGPLRFRNATILTQSVPHSRRLGELIQNALLGAAAGSMSVPCANGQLLTIVVMSVRGRDVGRFADQGLRDTAALVYIVDPANRSGVPIAWFMDGFGLTQAEARVAIAVASGLNIPEVARQMGLSPNTVKTHLRRVFDKTGTARQAELARLMALLGAVRGEDEQPKKDPSV
jgi:DNA-binding CsgD family transcriptional regulator